MVALQPPPLLPIHMPSHLGWAAPAELCPVTATAVHMPAPTLLMPESQLPLGNEGPERLTESEA